MHITRGQKGTIHEPNPPCSPPVLVILPLLKVYIVSFRTHDDRRPFIVLADNMRSASIWLRSMEGRTSNRGSTNPPHKPSR